MSEMLTSWIEWFPELISGYWLSIQVTAIALFFGIPAGLALAVGTDAKSGAARTVSLAIVELGRGAPVLILLQFFYFGLPTTGLSLSSYSASIFALAWSTAAYTSEIIRGGLKAVPSGQLEAAKTIGLKSIETLRIIILPQALRISLPPLLGFSLVMLQTTSLCFTIALPELVSKANEIGSSTFQYMSVLTLTGLMFAAVCIPATFFVAHMEKRLNRHQ